MKSVFPFLKKIAFVAFLSISIFQAQAMYSEDGEYCQKVVLSERPIHTRQIDAQKVQTAIVTLVKREGLQEEHAKGRVGELIARREIEAISEKKLGAPYVSIYTYFHNKGCAVTEHMRDSGDQGIDDIYVVLKQDGYIDKRYNPIYHEAKYDGNGVIKLKGTKTRCMQLSNPWLRINLEKSKARTTAHICVPGEKYEVGLCSSCKTELLSELEWLAQKLEEGSFKRTASVLSPTGQFKVYEVTGVLH